MVNQIAFTAARGLSSIGTGMTTIALATLVYLRTHSLLDLGVLFTIQGLSSVIFGFFGGVLVDRIKKKKAILICDVVQGSLVLLYMWVGTLASVYVIAFLIALFEQVSSTARQAIIPNLISEQKNCKDSILPFGWSILCQGWSSARR